MSEQITSAMLDELERLEQALEAESGTGFETIDPWPVTPAENALILALLNHGSALIAAARRAERLHTFVSDIAAMAVAGQEIPDGLGAVCWRDALQAIARVAEHAALTPEPPQRSQERAHSPEAGGGV